MGRYRANSKAFQARWHRQLAADLLALGDSIGAADRIQRAETIEQELVHNRQCGCCSKPLTDDDSVDSGYGAQCRQKMKQLGRL